MTKSLIPSGAALLDHVRSLRRSMEPPNTTCFLESTPEPDFPGPVAVVAAVLAARLVRCADCRHARYRSFPPARTHLDNQFIERLECDHGLTVTERELTTATRYCTLFNHRPPNRKE